MFKIGDFSKLSQISIKALRLYDRMGLLKPFYIDPATNYRYYSAQQMPRINRILAFKDLGFSLGQIGELLDEDLALEQIRGMLRVKQAELQQQLASEQLRLSRVAARIRQIEQENTMANYDVVVKQAKPIKVASIRNILPSYYQVGELFNELIVYLQQHRINKFEYCAAIWHDGEYKESDVDSEVVVAVDSPLEGTARVKVYELPAFDELACIIHQGSYQTLRESYNKLLTWIETNDYQIIAPNRELYIQGGSEPDDESYITEIQFPVQKQ